MSRRIRVDFGMNTKIKQKKIRNEYVHNRKWYNLGWKDAKKEAVKELLKTMDKFIKERTFEVLDNENVKESFIRFLPFEWEDLKLEIRK